MHSANVAPPQCAVSNCGVPGIHTSYSSTNSTYSYSTSSSRNSNNPFQLSSLRSPIMNNEYDLIVSKRY